MLWIIILILVRMGDLCAQSSYNVPSTGNQSVNTCDAMIYDHAGANANYGSNCSGYLIIYPSSPNSKMAIVGGSYNTESGWDEITVYNGAGTGGTQLAHLSGNATVANSIISTAANGALTIKFSSDGSVEKPGFALHVMCIATVLMSNTPLTECDIQWCDPGGSGNYANNQDITQTICSQNGEKLRVTFSSFSLAGGDSLYVYDGGSTSAFSLGSYTGTALPPQIVSTGSCLTFRFVSNASGVSSGWLAGIKCVTCVPVSTASGSPCAFDNIHPFCTDEGQYTYNSGTTGTASSYFGSSEVGCLGNTPAPAWYYMRVDQPGDLTIYIQQYSLATGSGIDVDFACWGPYMASSQSEFVENLCCGFYTHNKNTGYPNNTSYNSNYPYGDLVDCSYNRRYYEYCNIHDARTGEYYLLLITNYSRIPGVITFNSTDASTATTDCSIMAAVSNTGPYCLGDTVRLVCNNPQAGATYSWTGPNGWTSSQMNPTIYPVTADMEGNTYGLVKTLNGNSSDTAFTTVHVMSLNTAINVSTSDTVCLGQSVTLSVSCDMESTVPVGGTCSNLWFPGGQHTNSVTVAPEVTTTYVVQQTFGYCVSEDSVTIEVRTLSTQIHASDTEICRGDTVTMWADCPAGSQSCVYLWNPGSQNGQSVDVVPNTSTDYFLQQTIDGCIVRDTLHVQVNMPSLNNDTVYRRVARDLMPYVYLGQSYDDVGMYDIHLTNSQGCDSLVTLVLRYLDTIFVNLDSTICPNLFPFEWNGLTFHQDSIATLNLIAHNGADSIVKMTVRHYPNPIQSLNLENEICAGDTLPVSIGLSPQSVLVFVENSASVGESQKIFLPDGMPCPPDGYYYRSIAIFNQFIPGSVMTNVNDILYVRLKMEHSALEDLKMSLVCPNGSRSKLIADYNNITGSWGNIPNDYFRTNLGLANRLTDVLSCDSTLNPIGEPWNYIWSNNTNHNYQYAAGTYGYCYESVNIQSYTNPYWDYDYPWEHTHESVKPSNPVSMTQIYHPYQSFSNLIGCPLNGQWYIEVQDMLPNDNGYLTEWELALDPSLLQTITPSVVSKQLIGPWVTRLTDSTFIITPPENLMRDTTVSYRFVLQTDVGCQFDTTVSLTVHPQYDVVRDTSVCDTDVPITWEGVVFNAAATQTLRLQSIHGCDSIVTLNLTVKASSSHTETVESCDAYTWQDGTTYTASTNEPTVRLQNAEGCDSIVMLQLTILNSVESVDEVFACDSLIWIDGNTYYESTETPEHVIVLPTGCDSIVHLHLTLGHSASTDTTAEACGVFNWHEHKNILNSCDNLTHVFSSASGCDSTVTLHLTVFPLPEACFNYYTLGENYEIGTMLHFEECTPNMINYHWEMGNSEVFEEPAFDYAYMSAGTYRVTLRVTDENGCSAERHRIVVIKSPELQIFVPNSFTPNSDGLNDVFKPTGLHITDDQYLFVIYDRWGEVVFRTTDPEQGWDGTYKGQLVPPNSVMSWTLRCASDMGMVRKKGVVVVVY